MSPREIWRRFQHLRNRSRLERELEDEVASHRAMKRHDEPRFGNPLTLREESRDTWGWAWWDRAVQDVTFGARMLRKSPAFTLTAIGVLALGVGLNISAFQILNSIVFTPLPVKDPDSLVRFNRRSQGSTSSGFSYPAMTFYAAHNTVLAAAMGVTDSAVAFEADSSREVPIQFVTPNYLTELGAVPAWGRLLDGAVDGAPGAAPVVVLSSELWQNRFGSDPGVVGRTIRINGRPYTVAGVASASFVGLRPRSAQAWVPIAQQPYAFPGSDMLTSYQDNPVAFFGRLKPGVGARAAEAGLRAAAAALRTRGRDAAWEGEWVQALPAGRFATIGAIGPAGLIAATFMILLLIATCTNLATLTLARGFSREREISIRLSVGATRRRLVRQLLTESLMLSALGTAAGLGVSFVAVKLLLAVGGAPAFLRPQADVRVLLFSFAMAGVAAVLFGLTPALQAVRPRAARARARSILVAVQVAAGCTLLIISAMLVRGLHRIVHVPLGFEYAHHVTIDPGLSGNGFNPAAARAYWAQLRERLMAVPGVSAVALDTSAPLGNRVMTSRFRNGTVAYIHHIDSSYFAVMGVPIRRGRNLEANEKGAAVVSESFARAMWPGEDALGKVHGNSTVVGIAGNAPTISIGNPVATEFYLPIDDEHVTRAVLIVRVHGDPSTALGAIVAATRGVDPNVAPSVGLLNDAFDAKLRAPRQASIVISSLGVLTLALAAVGLAGLVSFTVSQRVREIGIRIALGARPPDVIRGVLQQFARPVAGGLAIGLLSAAALSIALRRELFGLSTLDPISYGGAAIVFSVVALAAAAGPLRRALKIDPVTALRCD